MTFILTMNPINRATFVAQQLVGKNEVAKLDQEKNNEQLKNDDLKKESEPSVDKTAKKQPPTLGQAEIAAQRNKAVARLIDLTTKGESDKTLQLTNYIIQEAIKAQLPQAQDIQRATKPALNEGLTTFAAAEVYKLFEAEQKKEKDKLSQTSFRDRFKNNPEFSEDIFDTAKFIVGVIKQYGSFDLEKIDLNGPDSQEARKAFENLNDPHKLTLITTVLQAATDHYMAETSAKLNDPLQSVQATAENSLALAKAVMAAENKARQQQFTLNKYDNLGIKPLGMA